MNSNADLPPGLEKEAGLFKVPGRASFYLTGLRINYTTINAQRYKYLEAGQGKPIILLHGAGGSKFMWRTVMRNLAPFFRVISLDLPGYTPFSSERHSFRHLSSWLWSFVDELGLDTFILGGYSAAAGISCYAASQSPERIEKLVLLSMPKWPGLNGDQNPLLFRLYKETSGTLEERLAKHNEVLFHSPPTLSSFMNKSFTAAYSLMESKMESIVETTNIGFKQLPARLSRILQIPMISIYGDTDRFGSEETTAYFKLHGADIRTHVIPQCGHLPFIEKPEELTTAMRRFLQSSDHHRWPLFD